MCCSASEDLVTPRTCQKCGVFQLCIVSSYRQVLFLGELLSNFRKISSHIKLFNEEQRVLLDVAMPVNDFDSNG